MTKKFITKLRQDKEFQKLYDIEKKKLDIAISLSKARTRKKLTQKDVANKSGVTWRTISDIENAKSNASINTLCKVFAAVGKRLDFQVR